MTNKGNSPVCERSSDLMAFLYNELNVSESREFQAHMQKCGNCREEAASFGLVRESIGAWREEVLTGFVPTTAAPTKRSAVTAFRQFFNLSPLWLKGAAAFAVLTFCVLIVLVFITSKKDAAVATRTDKTYTQQDVDRMVTEALAKQENTPVEKTQETTVATWSPAPPRKPAIRQTSAKNRRRPLSRAEREQLAADLRLLPTDDDLDVFGDRINQ